MKKQESAWKPLYKEGDVVKVIGNEYNHEFEIGEEVTIGAVLDGHYRCEGKRDFWYLWEVELELIKSK